MIVGIIFAIIGALVGDTIGGIAGFAFGIFLYYCVNEEHHYE